MAWTVPSEQEKIAYKKEVWYEASRRIFWKKFMGSNDGVVNTMMDLQKNPGDIIYIPILRRLTGNATVQRYNTSTFGAETQRLMGYDGSSSYANYDALTYYNDSVRIAQARNAVRSPGKYFHQQTGFDFNKDCNDRLAIWIAEFVDYFHFYHACGNIGTPDAYAAAGWPAVGLAPTSSATAASNRIIYGGNATSKGTLSEDCPFNTECIDRARFYAQTAIPKIEPVRSTSDGKEYYPMIIHTRQAYQLKRDPRWVAAHERADVRSKTENDIFSGALGIWNGVILYEHEWIYSYTDGGAGGNLDCARAILMGKNALAFAKCKGIEYEVDTTSSDADFGDKPAIAVGITAGIKKVVNGTVDNAIIAVDTYAPVPEGTAV